MYIQQITCTFNRYRLKNYRNHRPISATEYSWFERCANFEIQYLKEKDMTKNYWSYDFKNQYRMILYSDNCIPTAEGKQKNLKSLPKRRYFEAGFYHAYVTFLK
jgi:hypothetical protein